MILLIYLLLAVSTLTDHLASQQYLLGPSSRRLRARAQQLSAQQSVDGGVMLPPADKAEEYASFLSEAIRQHLDDEWMEQECHEGIGQEVARLYLDAFKDVGGCSRDFGLCGGILLAVLCDC